MNHSTLRILDEQPSHMHRGKTNKIEVKVIFKILHYILAYLNFKFITWKMACYKLLKIKERYNTNKTIKP